MRKDLFITAICIAAWAAPVARAGERVSLRNGFEMRCDHHAESEGRVRLYTGSGEDSYLEFAPEEIVAFEAVPDLPPDPATLAGQKAAPLSRSSKVRSKSDPDAQLNPADLHEMLVKAGGEHNVDVDLLASLVKAESGGNARAVSHAGARGLMQLMPSTAAGLGVDDSFKPDQNVRGGTTYLDGLLTRYHDNLALALAAYNAGPQAVDHI